MNAAPLLSPATPGQTSLMADFLRPGDDPLQQTQLRYRTMSQPLFALGAFGLAAALSLLPRPGER